jgi:hypothetical protein
MEDLVVIARRAIRARYSCEEQPCAEVRKVIAPFLCTTTIFDFGCKSKKRNGRHEETRTPDLYRVKVAL